MGFDNVNVNVSGPIQPISTYKTRILKGNHSFASQVTEPNMKYVIKHDFNLGGNSVTIPENCILEFDGGSLKNGNIIGDNTTLIGNKGILSNLTMDGSFANESINLDLLVFNDFDDISNFLNTFTKNYNTKVIHLGGKKFSAKDLQINHSLIIEGDEAVINTIKKDNHSFYGLFICEDGNEDFSIYLNNFSVIADDIDHDRNYVSEPLFYFNNCKELSFKNIHIDNYKGAYGASEYGLDFNGGILTSFDIRKLSIENCEFSNCGTFEWMACMPINLHRDEIDIIFNNNYIHDGISATPVYFVCNKLSICENKVRNYSYTGSLFNAHGYKSEFRNNDISNCIASSIFDTCEYGDITKDKYGELIYYSDTVICENNYCNCANGTLLVTWARHITIKNNTLIGQRLCFCQGSTSLGSNPDESCILPTNKLVNIINNYCICDNINAEKEPSSNYYNFVKVIATYDVGGDVVVDNNYFYRDNSKLTRSNSPFYIGNVKNLSIRNNTIYGCYDYVHGSQEAQVTDHVCFDIMQTYSAYYPIDLIIDNINIKQNIILDNVDTITLLRINSDNKPGLIKDCMLEQNKCYNSSKVLIENPMAFYDFNVMDDYMVFDSPITIFRYTNIKLNPRYCGLLKKNNIYVFNGIALTPIIDDIEIEGVLQIQEPNTTITASRGRTYKLTNNNYVILSGTWQLYQEDLNNLNNLSAGVHNYRTFVGNGRFYVCIYPSNMPTGQLVNAVTLRGTTASRPNIPFARLIEYYDITINKPIWYYNNNWRDATGAIV